MASSDAERLVASGASDVVFTLADLRDRITGLASLEKRPPVAPLPA